MIDILAGMEVTIIGHTDGRTDMLVGIEIRVNEGDSQIMSWTGGRPA